MAGASGLKASQAYTPQSPYRFSCFSYQVFLCIGDPSAPNTIPYFLVVKNHASWLSKRIGERSMFIQAIELETPSPHLRFGRALARLRRRHQAETKSQARKFLKEAKDAQDPEHPKLTWRLKKWLDDANLEPVFNYLTS